MIKAAGITLRQAQHAITDREAVWIDEANSLPKMINAGVLRPWRFFGVLH